VEVEAGRRIVESVEQCERELQPHIALSPRSLLLPHNLSCDDSYVPRRRPTARVATMIANRTLCRFLCGGSQECDVSTELLRGVYATRKLGIDTTLHDTPNAHRA
jgi:hypothetical protein